MEEQLSLRSLGEIPSSAAAAGVLLMIQGTNCPPPRDAPIQMISSIKSQRAHTIFIETARANDGSELSVPKANEKLEKKEQ